jgi:hypothetical protein
MDTQTLYAIKDTSISAGLIGEENNMITFPNRKNPKKVDLQKTKFFETRWDAEEFRNYTNSGLVVEVNISILPNL